MGNVDRGTGNNNGTSTDLSLQGANAIMTKEQYDALSELTVAQLKRKLRSLDVNLDQYRGLIEKKDLINFYHKVVSQKVVQAHDQKNKKMTPLELQKNV